MKENTKLKHKIMNKPNTVLTIISFLLPILGYILFFIKKDDEPEAASTYLWAAIGGSILGVIMALGA